VHDDLQRAGRRRLVATAAAGVALLSISFALLVFVPTVLSVFVLAPLFGPTHASGELTLAIVLSAAIGVTAAVIATAIAWRHAERDALRSAQLQLATVPGATIDVVPSWRVAGEPLPRVRRMIDTLSIAAGVVRRAARWSSIPRRTC
jgi:hypothetical protein